MGSWGNSSEEILRQQFPLHHACRDGDVQAVCALLGDVNELGPANGLFQEDAFYGWTPAHWAAYFGKLPCLVRLIEQGEVSCNISTFRFHQSPLHVAAFGGHSHCVQWLLQRGAQMERQDYLGETCLHKAARTGNMECVSLLVSQGARLNCKNFKSQTPAQLALACSYAECASYLERAVELQQPKRGIFQDLLPPVCHAPSLEKIESHGPPDAIHRILISQGLNGGAIPPTENVQLSHMNGESHRISQAMDDDSMDTGDATAPEEVVGRPYFNGMGGQGDAISNGDVLMVNGVGRNCTPVAGRKRGREEVNVECLKRICRGEAEIQQQPQMVSVDGVEAVTMLPPKFINPNRHCTQINAHFLQTTVFGQLPTNGLPVHNVNGHKPGMTNGNHWLYSSNLDSVTDSAVEHQTTVTMQQGYDSLIVDSLISGTHGI